MKLKKLFLILSLFIFTLNIYAVEKGITPSTVIQGESYKIYFNTNSNLASGNDIRISINGGAGTIKLDGGQQNWYKNASSTAVGNYTVEFKWFKDGSFQQSLGTSSFEIIELPKPSLSGGVNIVSITNGFKINSQKASGEVDKYEFYRSTSSGSLGTKIHSGSSRYYSDTSLSNGVKYYYQIKACNDSGCDTSDQDYATYIVPNQDPTVSDVTGSIDSNGNLEVSFSPYDPEDSSMGADIYLSFPNNTSSFQSLSKKNLSNFSGTSTRRVTYTKNELSNLNIIYNTEFKIRVNLFDNQSAEDEEKSSTITYNYEEPNQKPNTPNIGSKTFTIDISDGINISRGSDPDNDSVKLVCSATNSNRTTSNPFESSYATHTNNVSVSFEFSQTGSQTISCKSVDSNDNESSVITKSVTVNPKPNQSPEVNDITGFINENGDLTISFYPSDPESGTMGADIYISNPNDLNNFQPLSKKTLSNFSGTSKRTVTYTKDELSDLNITYNIQFKIRVNLFDDKDSQGIGYSSSITYSYQEIIIPSISSFSVTPTNGVKGITNYTFTSTLSSTLPNGYKVYLNFGTDNVWLNQTDDGGHIEMNCNNTTTCTKTMTLNGTGNRQVRAGVFNSSDVLQNIYSESKTFIVNEPIIDPKVTNVSPLIATYNKSQDYTIEGTNLTSSIIGNIEGTTTNCTYVSGTSTSIVLNCNAEVIGNKRFYLKDKSGGTIVSGSENINITVNPPKSALPSSVDAPVNGTEWSYREHTQDNVTYYDGIGSANDNHTWDINYGSGYDDEGLAVYAIEDGIRQTFDGWGGNNYGQLLIKHTNTDGSWYSGYLHMRNVTTATTIKKGDKIGEISRTGYLLNPAITSPHIHFGVYELVNNQLLSRDITINKNIIWETPIAPEVTNFNIVSQDNEGKIKGSFTISHPSNKIKNLRLHCDNDTDYNDEVYLDINTSFESLQSTGNKTFKDFDLKQWIGTRVYCKLEFTSPFGVKPTINPSRSLVLPKLENNPPQHIETSFSELNIVEGKDFTLSSVWNDSDGDNIEAYIRYKLQGTENWSEITLTYIEEVESGKSFEYSFDGLGKGVYDLQVSSVDLTADNLALHDREWIDIDGFEVNEDKGSSPILSFVTHGNNYKGIDFGGSVSKNSIPYGNNAVIKFNVQDLDNDIKQIEVNCDNGKNTDVTLATKNSDGTYTANCVYNKASYGNTSVTDERFDTIFLNYSAVAIDEKGNKSNVLSQGKNFNVYDLEKYKKYQAELEKEKENSQLNLNQKETNEDKLYSDIASLEANEISFNSDVDQYSKNIAEQLYKFGVFDLDKKDPCLWLNNDGSCKKYDTNVLKDAVSKSSYNFNDENSEYKYIINVEYAFNESTTINNYPAKISLVSKNEDFPVEFQELIANNSKHLLYQSIILTESFKNFFDKNTKNIESNIFDKSFNFLISKYPEFVQNYIERKLENAKLLTGRVLGAVEGCASEYGKEIYKTADSSLNNITIAISSDDWLVKGEHYSRAIYEVPLGAFVAISNCTDGAISGVLTDNEKKLLIDALQKGYNSLDEDTKAVIEKVQKNIENADQETKAIIELAFTKFDTIKGITKKTKVTNVGLKPTISVSKSLSNHGVFKSLLKHSFSGKNIKNRISGRLPQLRVKLSGSIKRKAKKVLDKSKIDKNSAGQLQETLINNYFKKVYEKEGYTFYDDFAKYGNSGDNGFDGVFIKESIENPQKVIIIESKPYKSGFTTNPANPPLPIQLTNEWIDYVIQELKGTKVPDKIALAKAIATIKKKGNLEKIIAGIDRAKNLYNTPNLVIMKVE